MLSKSCCGRTVVLVLYFYCADFYVLWDFNHPYVEDVCKGVKGYKKAMLSQGELHEAIVNFDTYRIL